MTYTKTFDELNLHFYPQWKEKLLETARDFNFPEEQIASCSIGELFEMIKDHQMEMLKLSERTILAAKTNPSSLRGFFGSLKPALGVKL